MTEQNTGRAPLISALILTLTLLSACQWSEQPSNRPSNNEANVNVANVNAAPQPSGNRNAAEAGDSSPEDFEGTTGIVEKKRPDIRPVILREVRTARHAGFDRAVFEFEGDTVPGYHVEYVDRPVRQCGSGQPVVVTGDGWLRVRLTPAQAHTEKGEPTVKDRDRRADLPVLKELKVICDFEADVEWVLGLSSPNRFRALELQNPPRLVIDVKH